MSKEKIFALLSAQAGDFVSGEDISAQLGISRAAVWKAVGALRRDGYTIEAQTGLGYRLADSPDVLSERELRRRLGETKIVGRTLDCFESVDSTNSYLKRIAAEGAPDGAVAVADEQTAGRGRRGRSFSSGPGRGVYLSALLRPQLAPEKILPLTALGAVADKVKGLRGGAEDYIVKPFEPVELLARIEVVLRRAGKSEMHLRYGDIQVDIEKHTALKNGMPVALTPKEFDVLVFFMRNPDVAITREQLLSNIWGFDFTGESRSVDIHVQQVRRKMGLQGKLITIPKLGYRLERR